MTYSLIEEKLNQGKTIILDGGIGGELQKLGAKMDKGLWCGRCSIDSPNELLKVHKNYINAGADVITTNTYASTPISMKKYGYKNLIEECNLKSVKIAKDAAKEFKDLDLGLDFVNDLKPYTYKWDKRSKYVDWDTNPDTDLNSITPDGTHKENWLDVGFKAQDIETLEKAAGYDKDNKTNLTVNLSEDGKQYSMKYEKLVPILVKAIQELEARVATLES